MPPVVAVAAVAPYDVITRNRVTNESLPEQMQHAQQAVEGLGLASGWGKQLHGKTPKTKTWK